MPAYPGLAMGDYRQVDCAVHDRYELAIMRRQRLRLSWREQDGLLRIEVVRPLDLETKGGEEFLVFVDAAEARRRVRLDRILNVSESPVADRVDADRGA